MVSCSGTSSRSAVARRSGVFFDEDLRHVGEQLGRLDGEGEDLPHGDLVLGHARAEHEGGEDAADGEGRRIHHVPPPLFVGRVVEATVTERHPAMARPIGRHAPAGVPGVVKRLGGGRAGGRAVEPHVPGGERVLQIVVRERALEERQLELLDARQTLPRRPHQRVGDRLLVVLGPRAGRHRVEVGAVLQRQQVIGLLAVEPPGAGL